MKKHFLFLTEEEDGAPAASVAGPQNQGQNAAQAKPAAGTPPPGDVEKTASLDEVEVTDAKGDQRLQLAATLDGSKIQVIQQSNYLTNIPNKITELQMDFNNRNSKNPEIKDYFENVKFIKPDNSSNLSDRFNKLQTTIISAEKYSSSALKTNKDKERYVSNAKYDDDKKDTKFETSTTEDKEKSKQQSQYNYQNDIANKHLNLVKQYNWGEHASILSDGINMVRDLMSDLGKLTRLTVFSANFHKNYNRHLKQFVNTLNLTKAIRSKEDIERQITSNIQGNKTVSRMDKSTGEVNNDTIIQQGLTQNPIS